MPNVKSPVWRLARRRTGRQGSKPREIRKSLGLTQIDAASMLLASTFKIGEIEREGKKYLNIEDQHCKALERLMEKRASGEENPAT